MENLGILMSLALIFMTLIMLYFIRRLINLINQENKFLVQHTYLETIDEMITAIRAQQHDQISHLQTLYGYLQLEYYAEARSYLEEMIGDIKMSHRFAYIKDPGLSALAYTKTGVATARGISFNVSVSTDLTQLKVPPYELNRILGNLIDNSFDYVNDLDKDMKQVWLKIDRQDDYYVLEVSNCGNIDGNLVENIFTPGFTSKKGTHAGLGLSIVKKLVQQHRGTIRVKNEDNRVIFTVYFPIQGEDHHESLRKEIGSSTDQKFAGNY
ncbi:MAG: ATP-binding protein [Syntrophomonadaceae bacterium]